VICSINEKRGCIEPDYELLTIGQQCQLLGISRSGYYYRPPPISSEMQELLNIVDQVYTDCPFFGTRRMAAYLNSHGYDVGRKLVRKIYQLLALEAVYPKPDLSKPNKEHKVYPYLLRNVEIINCNQVWSTDITYSAPSLRQHMM
jgi:putative transposase